MADGRDEVGAARDWLRSHGVTVPDDAGAGSGGGTGGGRTDAAPTGRAGTGGAIPGGASPGGATTVIGRLQGSAGDQDGLRADGGQPSSDDRDGDENRRDPAPPGRARGRGRQDRRSAGRRTGRGSGADVPDRGRAPEADGPDADPEQVARTIVLRKLAAQARTRAELERALATKDVPEEAAETVLDRMSEVGLVDDAAFARDWVASRQQRRHLSRTALRRELQTKGVDRDVIDDALADVDGSDEHQAASDLARRRASTMAGLPREVAYRRLGGMLARRGFSSSVTARVLSEVLGSSVED